jgi:hypothetical protein
MSQKKKQLSSWEEKSIFLLSILTLVGILKFANVIRDTVKSKNKTATALAPVPTTPSTEPPLIVIDQKRDIFDLLTAIGVIAIPVILSAATIAFAIQQNNASQVQHDTDVLISSNQHDSDQNIAKAQHDSDQKIAIDDRSINALRGFGDGISDLLLHEGLGTASNGSEVATVAKAKMVATLVQLNGRDKGVLIKFLYETQLITGNMPIIDLNGADLSLAELQGMDLRTVNFKGADLRETHLEGASVTPEQLSQTSSLKNTHLPDTSSFPSKSWSIPNPLAPDKLRDTQCTIFRNNMCSA